MKTVEKVFEALKNEGLVPVMENFGISFKFQMTNYVYMEDENDESFFNLLIPNIYDVSEENEQEVLRAINNVNNSMKLPNSLSVTIVCGYVLRICWIKITRWKIWFRSPFQHCTRPGNASMLL